MSTLLIRHAECVAHVDDARRELRGASGLRRLELEPRFGREFGAVRVHTDTKAAESAAAIDRSGRKLSRSALSPTCVTARLTQNGVNDVGQLR